MYKETDTWHKQQGLDPQQTVPEVQILGRVLNISILNDCYLFCVNNKIIFSIVRKIKLVDVD